MGFVHYRHLCAPPKIVSVFFCVAIKMINCIGSVTVNYIYQLPRAPINIIQLHWIKNKRRYDHNAVYGIKRCMTFSPSTNWNTMKQARAKKSELAKFNRLYKLLHNLAWPKLKLGVSKRCEKKYSFYWMFWNFLYSELFQYITRLLLFSFFSHCCCCCCHTLFYFLLAASTPNAVGYRNKLSTENNPLVGVKHYLYFLT